MTTGVSYLLFLIFEHLETFKNSLALLHDFCLNKLVSISNFY